MWNEENSIRQKFYALPGASFALRGERWNLRIWGENLSNTQYKTFYFMSMGNSFAQRGNPITVGATLRINLNKD